jgi:hypothetical protein
LDLRRARGAERALIADLEQSAERAAALAVHAAHREIGAARGLQRAMHRRLRARERRQVHQQTRAQPGAGVGRARGQEAVARVGREREARAQAALQPLGTARGGVEIEAGRVGLDAEVILFVHHQAVATARLEADQRRATRVQQIVRREAALDQELPVGRGERRRIELGGAGQDLGQRFGDAAHQVARRTDLHLRRKRRAGEVAREPHAAGDDDVALRTAFLQPGGNGAEQGLEPRIHDPILGHAGGRPQQPVAAHRMLFPKALQIRNFMLIAP